MRSSLALVSIFSAVVFGCGETTTSTTIVIVPPDAGITDGFVDATDASSDAEPLAPDAGDDDVHSCTENEGLIALTPILAGGRTHPTGRGEQASAYDTCNGRIILFGGNDFQPEECADFGPKRFQGDTWMYSVEYDNWARLQPDDAPPARGRHSMVFDSTRKKIYLFGGRYRQQANSGDYRLFNDLWMFDVNTDQWTELDPDGALPQARANFAMVYDYTDDQLILFGGSTSKSGLTFIPKDDTYILNFQGCNADLTDCGDRELAWERVDTDPPPRRLFHSMAYDGANHRVVAFSGGDENAFLGPFYRDMWSFDIESRTWSRLWLGAGRNGPDGRINSTLVADESRNRLLLFAGHDDTRIGHRNDLWSFDNSSGTWTSIVEGDSGAGSECTSFCNCPPDFVEVDQNSPERRQYHTFEPILGEERALLFGGKSDCGYLDDTWSFDFESDEWTEVEPAGQGEACMRTGQEGCTDLCY